MDGENNGKHYFLIDDLGGFPIFLETPMYQAFKGNILGSPRCPITVTRIGLLYISQGIPT